MSDYSKAIWSLDSVSRSRPEPAEAAEVTSRAALLLPSFGAVVFAIATPAGTCVTEKPF